MALNRLRMKISSHRRYCSLAYQAGAPNSVAKRFATCRKALLDFQRHVPVVGEPIGLAGEGNGAAAQRGELPGELLGRQAAGRPEVRVQLDDDAEGGA